MCSPPVCSPGNRGPCVCRFILDSGPALVWFLAPAQRKGEGGGIRDARVKAHPVNWLTPEAQDPRHSHISPTPVAEIPVPPSIGSRQPRHCFMQCIR